MHLETIDEFIKVGNNTAIAKVKVEKCDRCGEVFYDGDTVRYMERIRKELKNKNSKNLIPIGNTFKVAFK
jgi:YgiT-type zinc finger domain-containing protein